MSTGAGTSRRLCLKYDNHKFKAVAAAADRPRGLDATVSTPPSITPGTYFWFDVFALFLCLLTGSVL